MIGGGLIAGLICCGTLAVGQVALAAAEPGAPGVVARVSDIADARVVDIRDSELCTDASAPGARCLPVSNFRDPSGKIIGFHALRWLLGTIGLSGEETVMVIGTGTRDVKLIAGLIYQAGQHRVAMLEPSFKAPANATPGETRSLSREVVYTAAMRIK